MRLETARLAIRDFRRSDAKKIYEITSEELILKYMRVWHESRPSGYYRLFRNLNRKGKFDIRDFNRYAVAIKQTDETVGMIGVGIDGLLGGGKVSLAYFMSERYAGQGLMTECVKAFTDYCFRNSQTDKIFITPETGNKASARVAEKCGYRYKGTVRTADIYEISRPINDKEGNTEFE